MSKTLFDLDDDGESGLCCYDKHTQTNKQTNTVFLFSLACKYMYVKPTFIV